MISLSRDRDVIELKRPLHALKTPETTADEIDSAIDKFEDVRKVLTQICQHLIEETSELDAIATLRLALIAQEEAIQSLENLIVDPSERKSADTTPKSAVN